MAYHGPHALGLGLELRKRLKAGQDGRVIRQQLLLIKSLGIGSIDADADGERNGDGSTEHGEHARLIDQDAPDHADLADVVVDTDQDARLVLDIAVKGVRVLAERAEAASERVEPFRDLGVLCQAGD